MTATPFIVTGSRSRTSLPFLRWCPPESVAIAVEPQQIDEYMAAHPDKVDSFFVLPENDRGFAFLMNRLCAAARAAGHRYMVFTDDDVLGIKRRSSVDDKFVRVVGGDAVDALGEVVEQCASMGLSQLAVSFSGQSWGATKAYQEPVGAWGVHVTDVEHVMAVGGYDESLLIFNDWELSARLISNGCRVGRTNLVTFEHKMKSHGGGAEDVYKRRDDVRAAAHQVAARYPHAARVVEVEGHGLAEVRFNWRRLVRR